MSWFRSILVWLGLAAEVAADVAPAMGAGAKTQADLEKAKAAAAAAGKLGTAIADDVEANKKK